MKTLKVRSFAAVAQLFAVLVLALFAQAQQSTVSSVSGSASASAASAEIPKLIKYSGTAAFCT